MKAIENRNQFIGCRVTADEMDDIQQRASLAGLNMSDYLRHQAQEKPIIKIYQPKELIYQLLAIGRNINQMTRLSNASKSADHYTVMQMKKEWDTVRELITAFVAGADTAADWNKPLPEDTQCLS